MRNVKYVKACPFLRDLGDSYLCVNNDKVADVLLDPLLNIDWSEELPPVSSEVKDIETCLFVLEVKDDGRLYCVSRKMFLKLDNKEIYWKDIRDPIILLKLNDDNELQDSAIDFCSTCLYKVLIASSPAFQARLDKEEKVKLGWSYILTKANELYSSLNNLLGSIESELKCENKNKAVDDQINDTISKTYSDLFNEISALEKKTGLELDFAATAIEWYQKLDEWRFMISKISGSETLIDKLDMIENTSEIAARLKSMSFDMVLKIGTIKADFEEDISTLNNAEKIFTFASISFEDYTFICNQFLEIVIE